MFPLYDSAGVSQGLTCRNSAGNQPKTILQVQGKACMATPSREGSHWLVRVLEPDVSQTGAFRELQGFISRSVMPLSAARVQRGLNAYPGCGRRPKASVRSTPYDLPDAAASLFTNADKYMSNESEPMCGDVMPRPAGWPNAGCAASLTNYQVPGFDPRWAVLTISSTPVSGLGYKQLRTPDGRPVSAEGEGWSARSFRAVCLRTSSGTT